MTKTNLELFLLVCLGSIVAGCSRTHSELGGDSSTHWLINCRDDAQCGALSCLCGVCSAECGRDHQCAELGARASCVPSPDGCGQVQLCDAECARAENCGSNMLCLDGRCRRTEPARQGALEAGSEANDATFESDAAGSPQPLMSGVDAAGLQAISPDGGASVNACAAQLAASNGTECLRSLGYSWNGAACEEVNCGCTGPGCSSLFATGQACEAAYAACLSPETQCSGLPWYRCFDHCPGDLHLLGGSRSLGECSGDCTFTLTFTPPAAASGSCLSVRGELRVDNTQLPPRTASFELSDQALEELLRLSRAIDGLALAPPDCTDCAPDGGSNTIVRRDSDNASGVEFAYPAQRPPLELRGVHHFVQTLIDQASVCRGDKLKSCYVDRGLNSLPLPACGENQRIAEGTCTCAVGFEQLSTLNGTPCGESCAFCQVPDSTCGAVCTQPCAGGPTVWDVFCAE
jgi:hypothetical protein